MHSSSSFVHVARSIPYTHAHTFKDVSRKLSIVQYIISSWLYTWHNKLVSCIDGHSISGNILQIGTNFSGKKSHKQRELAYHRIESFCLSLGIYYVLLYDSIFTVDIGPELTVSVHHSTTFDQQTSTIITLWIQNNVPDQSLAGVQVVL